MTVIATPNDPPIFHITHVENLSKILHEGALWCDAQRIARGLSSTNIGLQHIKQRRLTRPVETRAGGCLGDYVPFNFCPRSVMLYTIYRGHANYAGGQEDIVHLVSSVRTAAALGRPLAFTDRHAELGHALHFDDLGRLDEVPWHVMAKKLWTDVKEERQAEFLVHDFFPWTAIDEIAVISEAIADKVRNSIVNAQHKPTVTIKPNWYY